MLRGIVDKLTKNLVIGVTCCVVGLVSELPAQATSWEKDFALSCSKFEQKKVPEIYKNNPDSNFEFKVFTLCKNNKIVKVSIVVSKSLSHISESGVVRFFKEQKIKEKSFFTYNEALKFEFSFDDKTQPKTLFVGVFKGV